MDASLDDLIFLFVLYYTLEIIDKIVQYTNNHIQEPQDLTALFGRANNWYSITQEEIYLYFGIRIYMTLFLLDKIADY